MPLTDDASLLQLLCSDRALGARPRSIEHNLPPRDPNLISFVGRGEYLFKLWDWLIDNHSAVKTLTALGGTGKTAIAYEFCQQFLEDAPSGATKLVWLSAKQYQQYRGARFRGVDCAARCRRLDLDHCQSKRKHDAL